MWHNLWQWGLVIAGVVLTLHLAIDTTRMAWDAYDSQNPRQEVGKTQQKSPGESPTGDPLSHQ